MIVSGGRYVRPGEGGWEGNVGVDKLAVRFLLAGGVEGQPFADGVEDVGDALGAGEEVVGAVDCDFFVGHDV